jgi:hypothetical protein
MKKTESAKIVTTIAVAAMIAVAASMLALRAPATFAQSPSGAAENTTSTASSQPKIKWQQGTVTSAPDPLPGHSSHQAAMILPPKSDGTVYSGILTFTATKKVEVLVLQDLTSKYNQTANSDTFGDMLTAKLPPDNKTTVAITLITPDYGRSPIPSASIPFTGNALALHTLNGDQFAATYSVMYQEGKAKDVSNIAAPPSENMTTSMPSSTNSTGTNSTSGSNSTGE